MIDDKKIESAKEEIYEDRFLLNGEEIVFNNDEKEEMFYKEDIKEAIGLGAKWMQEKFLKDLWHPVSEKRSCLFMNFRFIMSKEKAKEYINNSIEVLNSMNWLISTQRTEAIVYLDKAIKELEDL